MGWFTDGPEHPVYDLGELGKAGKAGWGLGVLFAYLILGIFAIPMQILSLLANRRDRQE